MARLTEEQASTAVLAKLAANGGDMTHNALVAALEADGNTNEAGMLAALRRAGYLDFRVDWNPDTATAVLHVTPKAQG